MLDTVCHVIAPDPLVCRTWFGVPSAVGRVYTEPTFRVLPVTVPVVVIFPVPEKLLDPNEYAAGVDTVQPASPGAQVGFKVSPGLYTAKIYTLAQKTPANTKPTNSEVSALFKEKNFEKLNILDFGFCIFWGTGISSMQILACFTGGGGSSGALTNKASVLPLVESNMVSEESGCWTGLFFLATETFPDFLETFFTTVFLFGFFAGIV